jgi:hypothetical protein
MIESIRRWLGERRHEPATWPRQLEWARQHQWSLRSAGEDQGFVVDGQGGTAPWRLEWGPSQRVYIAGTELRIRSEVGAPRELQALVLTRPLMEAMENTVFDQFVEGVQTRIDTRVPPEMRWLVMHPKLSAPELGALGTSYGALAGGKLWLQQWLAGPLSAALADAPTGAERPLVLMIARGRLTLRTAAPDPDVARLKAWLALFECALREARRVVADYVEPDTPSTQPSLFHPAEVPSKALSR